MEIWKEGNVESIDCGYIWIYIWYRGEKTLTNEQLMSKAMYNVYCTWLPAVKTIKKLISQLIVTYL